MVIDGGGTPERAWRPFLDELRLPGLGLAEAPERAVVVAPHPDDEILGVGGLLTMLAAAGTEIALLAVTDGEASHPGGSVEPGALADLREAETGRALAALGVTAELSRLRLPDGGREGLEQPVLDALELEPGTWLLGPWRGDGHPDHEAVGRACVTAATRDGARLLAYPVWAWHWATPHDERIPWTRAAQVHLTADIRAAKARAVAEFVTQIRPLGPLAEDAPVLAAHILERFARPYEVVLT